MAKADQPQLDDMPPAVPKVNFSGAATPPGTFPDITEDEINTRLRLSIDVVVTREGHESYKTQGTRKTVGVTVQAINSAKVIK